MAFQAACGDVEDVFVAVLFHHFERFMTQIARVLHESRRVAGRTSNDALVPVVQREAVASQGGRLPGVGRVAAIALQTEQASMKFRLGMAIAAGLRRTFEAIICMAVRTSEC